MVRYTILTKMKKILFILLTVSILASSIGAKTTLAQATPGDLGTGQWWMPGISQFAKKIGTNVGDGGSPANEIFGERYTFAQVVWIIDTLSNLFVGDILKVIPANKLSADASTAPQTVDMTNFNPGVILSLAGYADTMTKKPASGIDYVAQKMQKLDPVTTVYAQGYGYTSSLLPIQGLWMAARNAAYLLMTFVVVILAVLVMLRQKISPQVVLTAQSALPRVAIALLAITFSYAIAGFIVDLGFVVQGVVSGLMAAIVAKGGAGETIYIFNQVNNGVSSIFMYAMAFLMSSFSTQGGIIANIVNGGSPLVDGVLNAVFTVGGTLDVILGLVVAILLVVALFRIFFLMLMTYVKFILTVISGPFVLLMSVLGVGGGLTGWLRSLIAQMAVFVAVGLLVMFAHVFFWGFGNDVAFPPAFAIPGVNGLLGDTLNVFHIKALVVAGSAAGNVPTGFSFGNNISSVGFFVSLVVMLSIPKIASAFRDQIATGRGSYGFSTFREAGGPVAGGILAGVGLGKAFGSKVGKEIASPYIEKASSAVTGAFKGAMPPTKGGTR